MSMIKPRCRDCGRTVKTFGDRCKDCHAEAVAQLAPDQKATYDAFIGYGHDEQTALWEAQHS